MEDSILKWKYFFFICKS